MLHTKYILYSDLTKKVTNNEQNFPLTILKILKSLQILTSRLYLRQIYLCLSKDHKTSFARECHVAALAPKVELPNELTDCVPDVHTITATGVHAPGGVELNPVGDACIGVGEDTFVDEGLGDRVNVVFVSRRKISKRWREEGKWTYIVAGRV